MMHLNRRWNVTTFEDNDEIAMKLHEQTWTLCTAFKTAAGTVWVNDSTSPDALQEYAVLRRHKNAEAWSQVESITVSWCSQDDLKRYLDQADGGRFDASPWTDVPDENLEDDHDPCPHCM